MQEIRLTPTSYIVLGLLARRERTPYELKTSVAEGVGNMWSLQHTQLYAEPERLAAAGYLTVTQEETGRRRKVYRITVAAPSVPMTITIIDRCRSGAYTRRSIAMPTPHSTTSASR